MKNSVIQIRIDQETKTEAEKVIKDMGLTFSSAIQMFLRQIIQKQEIPFTIESRGYNQETLDAFEETLHPEKLKKYDSFEEILEDIFD